MYRMDSKPKCLIDILLSVLVLLMITIPVRLAAVGSEDLVGGFKSVIAEGVGASPDKAKARDDALVDAQRRVIEQAVGLFIKSDTLVQNTVLVEDTIYRHSSGYVHSYKVLSESYADGESRVKIEAEVAVGKIEEDLQDIAERLRVAGSPRIIVDVAGPRAAATKITEMLVDNGFKVLDSSQLTQARWVMAVRMLRDRKTHAAETLALQDAADVVITGVASLKPLGKPELQSETTLDFYRADGTLDVRAVRTYTAEVLCAGVTKVRKIAFEQAQANEDAVNAAAETWVGKNLGKLVKAAVDPAHEYSVFVTGCRQPDLDSIDSQLRDLRFVRATRLRAFDKDLAQMEVDFAGTAKNLAREMSAFKNPRLVVDTITSNTIRVGIKR